MDYRKQIGYLKGLCKGLTLSDEKPEGKLLIAIVDTLDALADVTGENEDARRELESDLQELSDEVGELETLSEDMDRLEEYLDELGETMQDLTAMLSGAPRGMDAIDNLFADMGHKHDRGHNLRLLDKDELPDDDDDEFDDEEEIVIYAVCPHCGQRIEIDDGSVVIEKKDK
ncbi:hypothetical protein FACS18949_15410 [Clostridia bacterium]|nr:hypothetical protein FACS18949_15410 [Clostridia bacterium]